MNSDPKGENGRDWNRQDALPPLFPWTIHVTQLRPYVQKRAKNAVLKVKREASTILRAQAGERRHVVCIIRDEDQKREATPASSQPRTDVMRSCSSEHQMM